MAIPDYQTLMLPLLKMLALGVITGCRNWSPPICKQFSLTEAEQKELTPSGCQFPPKLSDFHLRPRLPGADHRCQPRCSRYFD